MQFIYIIRPHKDNFVETMTDEERNIMSIHASYLNQLLEKGILILAGPVITGAFGVAIIEVNDEIEAKKIMLNDPAVSNNIMSAELFPFRVSFFKK
jgi:uncharacterized protein YciI